jgi:hypothetical protein
VNCETSRSTEVAHFSRKVFRNLNVYGDPELLIALVAAIESRLTDGWSRDLESEQYMPPAGGKSRCFIFARCASALGRAVKLALWAEGCRLSVPNIVPGDDGDGLSYTEYNSALIGFYLRFLAAAASEAGLFVELTPGERSLEEAFGWEAARLLKKFSLLANKSSAHPADIRRWMDFLVRLHNQPNRNYDFDLLAASLIESGWSLERTRELISECEFAIDLLRVYDPKICSIDDDQ